MINNRNLLISSTCIGTPPVTQWIEYIPFDRQVCKVYTRREEPDHISQVPYISIYNLYTEEKFRRQGYVKTLLDHILNQTLYSVDKLFILAVFADNIPAYNLYTNHLGFTKHNIQSDYSIPTDLIILSKQIKRAVCFTGEISW